MYVTIYISFFLFDHRLFRWRVPHGTSEKMKEQTLGEHDL